MSDKERFEQWAIVDLFGHQRIAGLVSEAEIGGCAFVRVDVPALDHPPDRLNEDEPAYTRYFGQGAIYSISPVPEKIALMVAARHRARPVQPYELPARLAGPATLDPEDPDDGFEPEDGP